MLLGEILRNKISDKLCIAIKSGGNHSLILGLILAQEITVIDLHFIRYTIITLQQLVNGLSFFFNVFY